MPPRKTILIVCGNEVTASVLRTQMDVWGYAVTVQHDRSKVAAQLAAKPFDLVLMKAPEEQARWQDFAQLAEEIYPLQKFRGSKLAIYDKHKSFPDDLAPGVDRIKNMGYEVEHLRHSLKSLMARKRGPNPNRMSIYIPEAA
jgi:hypothetical protein